MLPLLATAIQTTASSLLPHFTVVTSTASPVNCAITRGCHSSPGPFLSIPVTVSLNQLSSCLLFLHLQRVCSLGLFGMWAQPHDGQVPPNRWHFDLNLFLTTFSLPREFSFTILGLIRRDQDLWTSLFNRVPASPCTYKTHLSHFAGNGEV